MRKRTTAGGVVRTRSSLEEEDEPAADDIVDDGGEEEECDETGGGRCWARRPGASVACPRGRVGEEVEGCGDGAYRTAWYGLLRGRSNALIGVASPDAKERTSEGRKE